MLNRQRCETAKLIVPHSPYSQILALTPQIPLARPVEPTVTIDSGAVIGTTTILPSSTVVVNKFLGIPFAISPPKRFSPPVPVPKWPAPRKAQAFTNACMQQSHCMSLPLSTAHGFWPNELHVAEYLKLFYQGTGFSGESEDCLYLNVYTPAGSTGGKPVIFWIYGGNLQLGTAMQDLYDGSSFAANHDLVVVSANYRTNGMSCRILIWKFWLRKS